MAAPLRSERLPTLNATRVRLRWLEAEDAGAIYAIFADREVTRYWSTPAMTRREQAEDLIQSVHRHFAQGDLYQWGIADLRDDRVIGTVTLARLDWSNRRTEIGFSLRRQSWGQGLAREATTLGVRFAFDALDMRRIEADVDPRNTASIALLERLGFSREGLARERWEVGGEIQDSLLMGLLARDAAPS